MNILFDLFFTFVRIGLFTFGGGYAMLAIVENICVDNKAWISHEEMMDLIVIAESTPGSIGINCATFTGYKKAGFLGALAATLGVILPSFLIIYFIFIFLADFFELEIMINAFKGIKIAVGILISDAAITMIKKTAKNRGYLAIIICSAIIMLSINLFTLNISSISLMLMGALLGLILHKKEAK